VLAALQRLGWTIKRQSGSHRTLALGIQAETVEERHREAVDLRRRLDPLGIRLQRRGRLARESFSVDLFDWQPIDGFFAA
jgi:hypothetical protein